MDLTPDYPRSPRETLDGMMLLPRAIDKARAQLEDKLGDYVYYGCNLNAQLVKALGVTEDQFLNAVRAARDDEGVVSWIRDDVAPSPERIEEMNAHLLEPPNSKAEQENLEDTVDEIDPGNERVKTWIDLIDLEEGRLPKESATAT